MSTLKKVGKYILNKNYRFIINANRGMFNKMPDDEYLKRRFKACMGEELHLDNPQTFNEKLQWLKLYDRKPEYTIMVDKYKVREYIKEKIGEEYLIPLLGVWDKAEDIDFDALPNQFVLKCNHNSGLGLYICKDKSKLTENQIKAIRKNLAKGLKQDYYLMGREWPYKDVPRKIIAEKYMEDSSTGELNDYKFMCFNGKVKCIFVCSDRFKGSGLKITFYDTDWNVMPFERPCHKRDKPIDKPKNYDKMMEIAEHLSKDIPFVRTDFYEINGDLYFGELTFYPGSGFEEFEPKSGDDLLGKWIKLIERKN